MGDVLVIGATGKVGSLLVASLAAEGVAVRAATRSPEKASFPAGVAAVKFDLADPSTFAAALEGVDRLFVIMPPGSPPDLFDAFLAVALPKVKRVVTMTGAGAGANDTNPQRVLEKKIEAGAKEWTHVRPSFFMQNFNAFHIHAIKATGSVMLPVGESRTSFIDARDIASAAAAALTKDGFKGKAFVLTGPAALTYGEAAEILSKETGATIGFRNIDDDTFRKFTVGAGMAEAYATVMINLYAGVRGGMSARTTDGVKELTGHAPRDFADYARTYRSHFA